MRENRHSAPDGLCDPCFVRESPHSAPDILNEPPLVRERPDFPPGTFNEPPLVRERLHSTPGGGLGGILLVACLSLSRTFGGIFVPGGSKGGGSELSELLVVGEYLYSRVSLMILTATGGAGELL